MAKIVGKIDKRELRRRTRQKPRDLVRLGDAFKKAMLAKACK